MKKDTTLEKMLLTIPKKERNKISSVNWTEKRLQEAIKETSNNMKYDLQFGIPWIVIYGVSHFTFGPTPLTITILVLGFIYFLLVMTKRGSYGLNRRKKKIFEYLLSKRNGEGKSNG